MKEITISSVIKALKKDLKFISTFIFVGLVLVAGYSFIMPKTFQSNASIMPQSKSGGGGLSSFLQTMAGGLSLGGIQSNTQSAIFKDILQSTQLADFIIEELKNELGEEFSELDIEDQEKMILSLIETEDSKSGLIYVSCSFGTPYFATPEDIEKAKDLSQKIAVKSVEGLNTILQNNSNSKAKQSRIYIEKEIGKYRLKLDTLNSQMQTFQEENNVLAIEEQAQAVIKQAVETGSELLQIQNELNLAKIQYNDNSPMVIKLQKQVDYLQQQVSKLQIEGMDGSEFSIPLKDLPALSLKYTQLLMDKEILEKVILYLETQRHQEAIQENKDVEVVQLLDVPKKPNKRSSPRRSTMMFAAFFFLSLSSILLSLYRIYKK